MAKVEVYSKSTCPYCKRAKSLFRQKGIDPVEIDVGYESERRQEMIQRSRGRTTVPQIFIDGQHIGGCDDLFELERVGRLDELLAA